MMETTNTESQTSEKKSARKAPSKGQQVNTEILNHICDRAFYMALRMIDIANHDRPEPPKGSPKVGGHPSACGSSKHILTALHMVARGPDDYIACKPHVSPMDHALNFLLHNFRDASGQALSDEQRRKAMHHLRHYSPEGEPVFQSYHAETDPDCYRFFPSGSVGIPPVNALYTALGYEFVKGHGIDLEEEPFFWCLMGDSEFREGSLMEAMPDAGERQLGRVIWIVDYNRQNLDGVRVSNEEALGGTDADRIAGIAEANGWEALILEHGKKRQELFDTPDGDQFRWALEEGLAEFEFQALLTANNAELIRERLQSKSSKLKSWLKNVDDKTLHEAFFNLGGHDMQTLIEAYEYAKKNTARPTLILPYTVKGHGLRCQALSGNHNSLPERDELEELAGKAGLDFENAFEEFESSSDEGKFLKERSQFLVKGIEKNLKRRNERAEEWREKALSMDWPKSFNIKALKMSPVAHTQWMWGQIAAKLDRLAREKEDADLSSDDKVWATFAKFFLTMAPDVGSTTNTSPNMNGKIFGDIGQEDFEETFHAKDKKAPDVIPNTGERTGHLRFEIAEGNCMSAAGSFGKFGHFTGLPYFPAMTIYDFFIKRCHDQLYYNLYWKSEFMTIGTPSGVTLSPEGAQHSWKSDFQIPNSVLWEPAFAMEVDWILADTLRRHFTGDNEGREASMLRCVTRGLVQRQWMERLRSQKRFKSEDTTLTRDSQKDVAPVSDEEIHEVIRTEVLEGGYPLIQYEGYEGYVPGDNVVHLFSLGALVNEAIEASDALAEKGIFANVYVVTSPDLLLGNYGYRNDYEHLQRTLGVNGDLHLNPEGDIEGKADWFAAQGARIPIVSVHDGEPGLLDNIGAIVGVKHRALAVRRTSKSGTVEAVYRLHGIDAEGILDAAEKVLKETAHERIRVNPDVLRNL